MKIPMFDGFGPATNMGSSSMTTELGDAAGRVVVGGDDGLELLLLVGGEDGFYLTVGVGFDRAALLTDGGSEEDGVTDELGDALIAGDEDGLDLGGLVGGKAKLLRERFGLVDGVGLVRVGVLGERGGGEAERKGEDRGLDKGLHRGCSPGFRRRSIVLACKMLLMETRVGDTSFAQLFYCYVVVCL